MNITISNQEVKTALGEMRSHLEGAADCRLTYQDVIGVLLLVAWDHHRKMQQYAARWAASVVVPRRRAARLPDRW